MSDIQDLIIKIRKFNRERSWAKFHNFKDLAISLALEASEVLEHFQWKSPKEIKERVVRRKQEVVEELADVFLYLLQISDKLKIDIVEEADKKLKKAALKYPVEKSKGNHTKYTEL